MRRFCLYIFVVAVAAQSAAADELACRGETPFWTLDLNLSQHTAIFQRTGEDSQNALIDLTAFAQGTAGVRAFSIVNRPTAFTGIAVTAPAACVINDDDSYSHRVEFLTQSGTEAILLTGCCRAVPTQ